MLESKKVIKITFTIINFEMIDQPYGNCKIIKILQIEVKRRRRIKDISQIS